MVKRIKILFTIPNFDTAGSGKVVYDLVKRLDKTMFEPEICCFHNKGEFFKTIEKLDVKIHLFRFAISYKPYITFPFRVFKIYKFFKRQQFDMIHSWHWSSDISEPLAAKLAGIPFVYTKKAMSWGNKSWIWRSRLSRKIITINKDMVTQFFSHILNRVAEIPLGVDTNYFKPLRKTYVTPEGIRFAKDDFIILSVANLVPVKGMEILLEAVSSLNDNCIKVLIVGTDDTDYGIALKKKYVNNENINFFGKKLDVRPYLAIADVFVIPTKNEGRKEGLPIAPIEAMAQGVIVLGANVSGIKDVLRIFPNQLFEAGNSSELAIKINWIKSITKEKRNKLSNDMRLFVNDAFSMDKFILSHQKLYQEITKVIIK